MRSILFSTVPLLLVFYVNVWVVGTFIDVVSDLETSLPLVTRVLFLPQFPLFVLMWLAVILVLAIILPGKRQVLWHLALWPGLVLIIISLTGLFMPLISSISNL